MYRFPTLSYQTRGDKPSKKWQTVSSGVDARRKQTFHFLFGKEKQQKQKHRIVLTTFFYYP